MNWTETRERLIGCGIAPERLPEEWQPGIDLSWAKLTGADLTGAYLSGAILTGADLSWAILTEADLTEAIINWRSHDLVAEILRQHAGDCWHKRALAGLVLISRYWCWDEFLALPLDADTRQWALETLAAYVQPGDNAPRILRRMTRELD